MMAYVTQAFNSVIKPPLAPAMDEIEVCLGLLHRNHSYACQYQDGDFDQSQWSDVTQSQYADSIAFDTTMCLFHGPSDNQARFQPYTPTTNAQVAKVAARM
jgi:hypothetical protein